MSPLPPPSWEQANQTRLMAEVAQLAVILKRLLRGEDGSAADPGEAVPDAGPPALDRLCALFGLSSFERSILLTCAGVELDSGFADLCASLSGERRTPPPTFSLALLAFSDAHWSALAPERPLRHWRLIETQPGDLLTTSPLRIDERVLHYLAGLPTLDERLRAFVAPIAPAPLPPSARRQAEEVAALLFHGDDQAPAPVVQICGGDAARRRGIAAAACDSADLALYRLSSLAAPRGLAEIDQFIRLWEREFILDPVGLLLEWDEAQTLDAADEAGLRRLVEGLRAPLLVAAREPIKPVERRLHTFDVPKSLPGEQAALWRLALGAAAPALDGAVTAMSSQFSLSTGAIDTAVAEAARGELVAAVGRGGTESVAASLWDACRKLSRPRLEGLAQRIETSAYWDDLVLPDAQKTLLRQAALQVRRRDKVYGDWGFGAGTRGLGISALFAGPSGVGKTMAAEVLANELRLDLYRVDLSQVISKYIGETEKNLRRVFDAADDGGAILLFDEADALFGKRSEVKDSHDRYANIEVSYLLQRIESYRGLAILTSNRKEALDQAFLRRIRFVVEFPFPEETQRAEIWLRVFPRQTPTEGLRIDRLARLATAGGNIRNIAMGAAFLAADADEPVRMEHLLAAARTEFAKIERPLSEQETAGWL